MSVSPLWSTCGVLINPSPTHRPHRIQQERMGETYCAAVSTAIDFSCVKHFHSMRNVSVLICVAARVQRSRYRMCMGFAGRWRSVRNVMCTLTALVVCHMAQFCYFYFIIFQHNERTTQRCLPHSRTYANTLESIEKKNDFIILCQRLELYLIHLFVVSLLNFIIEICGRK